MTVSAQDIINVNKISLASAVINAFQLFLGNLIPLRLLAEAQSDIEKIIGSTLDALTA